MGLKIFTTLPLQRFYISIGPENGSKKVSGLRKLSDGTRSSIVYGVGGILRFTVLKVAILGYFGPNYDLFGAFTATLDLRMTSK